MTLARVLQVAWLTIRFAAAAYLAAHLHVAWWAVLPFVVSFDISLMIVEEP